MELDEIGEREREGEEIKKKKEGEGKKEEGGEANKKKEQQPVWDVQEDIKDIMDMIPPEYKQSQKKL
jgi:hypothetical protein